MPATICKPARCGMLPSAPYLFTRPTHQPPAPLRLLQSRLPASLPPRSIKEFGDKVLISMRAVWQVYGGQRAAAVAAAAAAAHEQGHDGGWGADADAEDEPLSPMSGDEDNPAAAAFAPGPAAVAAAVAELAVAAPAPPPAEPPQQAQHAQQPAQQPPPFQLVHEEETDLEYDDHEGGGHISDDD